jgi:aquaporin Z
MQRKLAAEFFGTFWLVFCGCGSAVLAAAFPALGIGFLVVALAFGLTVLTMCYAVGNISGGHFNPAVSIGVAVAGRMPVSDLVGYIIAQLIGAIVAAAVLYVIASGKPDFAAGAFATNGYGDLSPGKYALLSCFIIEVVMTGFFIFIILATTHARAPAGFAPLAIGLTLTLIHLVTIPVTNTSVNPARSTGVAFFAQTDALGQLWLFWLAPIVGAIAGGLIWKSLFEKDEVPLGAVPAE